jgi:hypothetical protein
MNRGIVGGSLKIGAQTEAVGQLAVQPQAGTANNIAPVTDDLNVMQVDSRGLRRWGSVSRVLPERSGSGNRRCGIAGSVIVAAMVVFAQSALIGGLLIQHTRRRQAEALV